MRWRDVRQVTIAAHESSDPDGSLRGTTETIDRPIDLWPWGAGALAGCRSVVLRRQKR
jgi:hypothetical protein